METDRVVPEAAAGAIVPLAASLDPALTGFSLGQLLADVSSRLSALSQQESRRLTRQIADLVEIGSRWLETPDNRFSTAYVRRAVETFYVHRSPRTDLRGATFLELGCGAENPLAISTMMLLLGAERAFGVDDSQVLDVPRAVRGVGRVVSTMLMDPKALVGSIEVAPADVLSRMKGFDLAKLQRGDVTGLDHERLAFRRESIDSLSMADASCDLCSSSAVLEHVGDIRATACELARITKVGGLNVHNIDYNDHGIYDGTAASPIAFLTEQPDSKHVRTCNRVRHSELLRAFCGAGFEVVEDHPYEILEPSEADLRSLAPRFQGLSRHDLAVTRALVSFRRRG